MIFSDPLKEFPLVLACVADVVVGWHGAIRLSYGLLPRKVFCIVAVVLAKTVGYRPAAHVVDHKFSLALLVLGWAGTDEHLRWSD